MRFARALSQRLLKKQTKEANTFPKIARHVSIETILRIVSRMPGEWETLLSGSGYEFSRLTKFHPSLGNPKIHIPTLARTGEKFMVERSPLSGAEIIICIDVSPSVNIPSSADIRNIGTFMLFGGAAEKDMPVSFIAFSSDVDCVFSEDDANVQLRRVANWIAQKPQRKDGVITSFEPLASRIVKIASRGSLVFIVSDFLDTSNDLLSAMSIVAASGVDCTPVLIDTSRIWEDMPLGTFELDVVDPETGEEENMYLTPDKIQEIRKTHLAHKDKLTSIFRRNGFYHATLDSADPESCMKALTICFKQKLRRQQ